MTREEWLEAAILELSPAFKHLAAVDVPHVRVSVGWPGGRSNRNKTIGQIWYGQTAADGVPQVFISPRLSDGIEVLATLAHELVHSIVPDAKHGKAFGKIARAIGLEGKMTATYAGDALKKRLEAIIATIGAYPHAALSPHAVPGSKQSTRLLKAICEDCGYTIRVTKTWADFGMPLCPCLPSNPHEMVLA